MGPLVPSGFVPLEARKRLDFHGSHSLCDLRGVAGYEANQVPLVVPPVEGKAKKGVAVSVLVDRI
jgi:hypothetical protein